MAKDEKNIEALRHSLSHVMMQALEKMYKAIPGVGPSIENGFYHDFDAKHQVSEVDLAKIEEEMRKIIKEDLVIKKSEMPVKKGIEFLEKKKYIYTAELARDLEREGESVITFFEQGDFINMCKGPHIASTGKINPEGFKLTKLAGAYWKGDEKNKMIQRIYGVAFETKKELEEYLKRMEEAEKRNHIKLGKELELFASFNEIGPGLPVWLPKGYVIRRALEDYMIKMERSYGYVHIQTPHINRKELFETSGHWGFYNESMYPAFEVGQNLKDAQEGKKAKVKETYVLKPMNCPAGIMVYKMKPHSYRELPMKIGELGTVYRYEKSGEVHGLQRVRGFTQNDAHIFCTPEQLEDQFMEVMKMMDNFYKDLGFTNYKYRLSLSDAEKSKYVGDKESWKKAEETLRKVLEKNDVPFYEAKGEAAFYGPKLDVQAVNVYGKEDSISTIQVDFNLPERFELSYIDENGKKKQPFMIHRALIGSFERFFSYLIEYYAGAFPVWLSPVQVKILSVGEKHANFSEDFAKELVMAGIRAEADTGDETLGNKIRKASGEKIPYVIVIGDKEMGGGQLAVRLRGQKDLKQMSKDELIREVKEKIEKRASN
ncbi:MAG: threonine--tRNA ligase [Patescibacteria group bacterium]|jgi:threonyl-tRNA synthetase